jgi:hypothetical protein
VRRAKIDDTGCGKLDMFVIPEMIRVAGSCKDERLESGEFRKA